MSVYMYILFIHFSMTFQSQCCSGDSGSGDSGTPDALCVRGNKLGHVCYSTMAAEMAAELAATLLPMHIYCYISH